MSVNHREVMVLAVLISMTPHKLFPLFSAACSAAAGGTETVAEMFVNSSEGRVLKEQWEQAQCDKDIHECLNNMVLALLSLLHGHEHGTSRPTYNDTCGGAPSADA